VFELIIIVFIITPFSAALYITVGVDFNSINPHYLKKK